MAKWSKLPGSETALFPVFQTWGVLSNIKGDCRSALFFQLLYVYIHTHVYIHICPPKHERMKFVP